MGRSESFSPSLDGWGIGMNRGERWKPVVGLEGYYEVSNYGDVWSVRRERRLAITDRKGYNEVSMCVNYKQYHRLVHVLVAAAFIGPCPKGKEVNHKDLNKRNNWYGNLEYMTHKKNCAHAIANGRWTSKEANSHPGEKNGGAKLTWEQVRQIRKLYKSGKQNRYALADKFGVSEAAIYYIVNGQAWKEAA
jgi:hypothetical protein